MLHSQGTNHIARHATLFALILLLLAACTPPSQNTAPTADAGENQTVTVDTKVVLDGSGSSDPDEGDTLDYSWTVKSQPEGSSATLSGADSAAPSFTPDVVGKYVIELTVSDGEETATDTVTITANPDNNEEPEVTLKVASGTSVTAGTTVRLDGSGSTDPDGNNLTYLWTLSAPEGSEATLSSPNTAKTSFVADIAGDYIVELTVSDGEDEATDTVTITAEAAPVENTPPTAVDDAATTSGVTPVTITVLTNDSDADGDTLTVIDATTPTNGNVAVNEDNTITYTPVSDFSGEDSFDYTIADGKGGEATATVSITVTPVATGDDASTVGNTAVTINLLANDNGSSLTVTAIDRTDTQGDVVNNGDGTVTYTPPVGVTDISDSFDYTVSDGNATASATVTITIGSQLVWYVDDATETGDGRSSSPFNSLQAAEDASEPGDIIYLFSTLEGSTYPNDGFTLKANQQLLGQGVPLEIVAGEILFEATAKPTLTSEGVAPADTSAIQMATGSTVAGLSVANSTGDGIRVFDADGATIKDVEVIDSQANGINIYETKALPEMTVTLTRVIINDTGAHGIKTSGFPVPYDPEFGTALTLNMTDISITDAGRDGINSIDPLEFLLKDSTITNAGASWEPGDQPFFGIWLDDGIGGNYIIDNVTINMEESSALGDTDFAGIQLFANGLYGLGPVDLSVNDTELLLAETAPGGGSNDSSGLEIRFKTTVGSVNNPITTDPQVNLSGSGNTAAAVELFSVLYDEPNQEPGARIDGTVEINGILYPTTASPAYWIPSFDDSRYDSRF